MDIVTIMILPHLKGETQIISDAFCIGMMICNVYMVSRMSEDDNCMPKFWLGCGVLKYWYIIAQSSVAIKILLKSYSCNLHTNFGTHVKLWKVIIEH